jgi:hypothetical protein
VKALALVVQPGSKGSIVFLQREVGVSGGLNASMDLEGRTIGRSTYGLNADTPIFPLIEL